MLPRIIRTCKCRIRSHRAGIVSSCIIFKVFSFVMESDNKKSLCHIWVSCSPSVQNQHHWFSEYPIIYKCFDSNKVLSKRLANNIHSVFHEINVTFLTVIKFSWKNTFSTDNNDIIFIHFIVSERDLQNYIFTFFDIFFDKRDLWIEFEFAVRIHYLIYIPCI